MDQERYQAANAPPHTANNQLDKPGRGNKREEPPPKGRNANAALAANKDGENANTKRGASPKQYAVPSRNGKKVNPGRVSHESMAKLQRIVARITRRKSLYQCGCVRSFAAGKVVIASNDHKATAKGILLCRNTHLCPRCARWLARQRIDVLRPQIEELDGVNILVTLTVQRALERSLVDQNRVLDGAWRMTTSGAAHRRWVDQAGGFSFVRGFETGYSFRSGWGGHFHGYLILHDPRWPTLEELGKDINRDRKRLGLVQFRGEVGRLELENRALSKLASIQDRHVGPADYLMAVFVQRFRESVEAQGGSFRASRGAQDWQYAESFASVAYTGKGAAGWDALAEAAGGAFKQSGLLSIWDLAMMAHEGDHRAFALVNEYAEAMKGRRMLTVSRDLSLREDSELEPGETEADGVIEITDEGLKALRGSDGLGLARLLDLMPRIWDDPEAIVLALGQGGFGLGPKMWAWHSKAPPDGG